MSTPPLFWSAGSVEWKYEEMSDYWDLCKNGGHVFQTLGQWKPWGEALPEYCLRCSEKKPINQHEPKKEKPMAKIEINTHLFDGLSLEQRMLALVQITDWRNQAREDSPTEQKTTENGTWVCHVVRASVLNKLSQHLIDSTVEKFGGGE